MPRGQKKGFVPKNKTKWTEVMLQFLRNNYATMTNRQLADGLGLTLTITRNKLYELGLKRMEMEYWTKKQVQFLKSHYKIWGDVEIAEYFQMHFKKKKVWTTKHIQKKRKYLKLFRTKIEHKNIMERNIKIRGIGKISNRKRWEGRRSPVGTTKLWKQRRNNDERMFIKIGNGYVLLARHNWKKVHGSIPEGHVIRRIDQTKHDYSVENLECISWAEQSRRNFEHNDEWFAGCIAHGDQKLKKFLLENKDMLKIYRLNSKLRKEIKNARKQAS